MATPFEQPKLALKPLYMANDKNHIWVQPYGGLQKLESYDQVAGLSIKSAGGVMGAGRRVLPNIILGVLAGGAVNSYAQDEKKGDGNISNMYAGVYAAYSKPEGGFRVNGSVIGSQSHYKGNRNIKSLNLVAGNSHKGWDASGHIQAGYKIRYGRSSSVDPFVSVGFAHSYQEAYSETNANPFNLNVSSSTTQMGSIEIGSKFERSFMVNEAIVKPLLIVSALREHPIKKPTSATLSFTESGGSFTVPVSTQIKTYATATAGCVVMLKNNVSVSALVSGKIKKHEQAVSAVLKVSYNF
jgi:uncharacterized protein with beta-barrel porin domain